MEVVRFSKPNFRAKVREKSRPGSTPVSRILYAEDEAAARKYLVFIGLEVIDIKPYDFQDWLDKATIATDEALTGYPAARQAGKSYEFDSDIWGQLKDHLQDLFQGRCAYCEAWFRSVSFGDVEHYRPKAAVTEDPNHPGYYWLAYNPENYLPACSLCNTKGKKNNFPIAGTRVSVPNAALDVEKPYLFNPYSDRHCDHVAYIPMQSNHPDLVAGMAVHRTNRGEQSIKYYDLNREPLVRGRVKAQELALFRFKKAIVDGNYAGMVEIGRACFEGKEEFCTAAATEIDAFCKTMKFPRLFPDDMKLGV
jgi:hypothetical protein